MAWNGRVKAQRRWLMMTGVSGFGGGRWAGKCLADFWPRTDKDGALIKGL